jgi:hypothetical protein
MREIRTSGSMSRDGKRSVAAWPKLPRPSLPLPSVPQRSNIYPRSMISGASVSPAPGFQRTMGWLGAYLSKWVSLAMRRR